MGNKQSKQKKSNKPNKPNKSIKPNTPNKPNKPNKSNTPNKPNKPNTPNKPNNIQKFDNNNSNLIRKKGISSPKFKLIKNFDNGSSIYYCFELIDGRLYLCVCGDFFNIYNINDYNEPKKELQIYPGVYTVSSIQAHTGNIVICTYVKDMKIFSIVNNEVKTIQTYTPEDGDRENFVYELSNGQLITMNWDGRIKLFDLENDLYKEVKCFTPLQSFNAHKMREVEKYKIIVKGWNISNEDSKCPLYFCDLILETVKLIKDSCLNFDIMSNKNVIIFNKNIVEIFDYKKFEIITRINIPSDIEFKTSFLYNDKTLLFGCKNEEFIEYTINENKLIEIDRKQFQCHVNHYVRSIVKLKNDSIVVIGDTEVYILKPEN